MSPPQLALKPEASAEVMPTPERSVGGKFEANFARIEDELGNPAVAGMLEDLREHDPTTFKHVLGVSLYAAKMLEIFEDQIPLTDSETASFMRAGLLHDTGKLDISTEILEKPGGLTDEEFSEVKAHTMRGYEILRGNKDFSSDQLLLNLTLLHHQVQRKKYVRDDMADWIVGKDKERFKNILILFAMSDQTEAMTSDRNYIKAKHMTKADVIKNLAENLEAAGVPSPSATSVLEKIAQEPFFWEKGRQQDYFDDLTAAFKSGLFKTKKFKPRNLQAIGAKAIHEQPEQTQRHQ